MRAVRTAERRGSGGGNGSFISAGGGSGGGCGRGGRGGSDGTAAPRLDRAERHVERAEDCILERQVIGGLSDHFTHERGAIGESDGLHLGGAAETGGEEQKAEGGKNAEETHHDGKG